MRKNFTFLLIAASSYLLNGFCNNSPTTNQTANSLLNPQDVPIFYENNPLTGLKTFTVITSFPLKENRLQKQVAQAIENTLSSIGDVIHLKDNDMRGFGAGNVLLIQLGAVSTFNGKILPISRASLGIETGVCMDKTGLKTFPIIWSINTFLEDTLASSSEENLIQAIQHLISSFNQSFKEANQNASNKVIFYIYD